MNQHRRVVTRLAVYLNRSAGAVERLGVAKMQETVETAFAQHGVEAQIAFVSGAELHTALEQVRARAAAGKLDAIVVGGGDGSIRTAAGALAGTGIPLGILPLGTLNHFAKDLHVPLALDEAVAVIAAAQAQPVDVGEVNSKTFINNSSIGIYPYLVLDRERQRRQIGWSKWTAMALAVWRIFREFPLHRLIVHEAGWQQPVRTPCLFVGNNEYSLSLPNFAKRTRLDCGELCLYVSKPQSRLSLIWLAYRCIFGLIDERDDLRIVKVQAAEITSRRRRLLVAFDGEVEWMRPPLRYRTRPGALQVFVPTADG